MTGWARAGAAGAPGRPALLGGGRGRGAARGRAPGPRAGLGDCTCMDDLQRCLPGGFPGTAPGRRAIVRIVTSAVDLVPGQLSPRGPVAVARLLERVER